MFTGNMDTMSIPARVYALYKIVVNNNGIKRNDLLKTMEPPSLKKIEDSKTKTSYFTSVLNCALELKFVELKDGNVSLLVSSDQIQSIDDMRLLATKSLNEFKDYQFYQVTKAALKMNEKIFDLVPLSAEKSVSYFSSETKGTVTNVNMNGWRFWAEFLGFGYVPSTSTFIPNAYRFLKNALVDTDLKIGEEYTFAEFLGKVNVYGTILTEANEDSHKINMAFSNALRMLEANDEIQLLRQNDRPDNYMLYPSETNDNQPVTGLIYKGARK